MRRTGDGVAPGALPLCVASPPGISKPAPTQRPPPSKKCLAPLRPMPPFAGPWQHNPEIAALRQQHGIAAVPGIIIADTYPFNPAWESSTRAAFGPPSAGVTNSVPVTERVAIDVEMRGQGKIRREAAAANLTRTDWEIAGQEITLPRCHAGAFDTVVYRFRKRKLIEAGIELNTAAAEKVKRFRGKSQRHATAADEIFINTEVVASRAQLVPGQVALIAAWQDLYRCAGCDARLVRSARRLRDAAASGVPRGRTAANRLGTKARPAGRIKSL